MNFYGPLKLFIIKPTIYITVFVSLFYFLYKFGIALVAYVDMLPTDITIIDIIWTKYLYIIIIDIIIDSIIVV